MQYAPTREATEILPTGGPRIAVTSVLRRPRANSDTLANRGARIFFVEEMAALKARYSADLAWFGFQTTPGFTDLD